MGNFRHNKSLPAMAALALMSPAPVHAQVEHPRSYYPTLTRADISVCRQQFSALQADVVEHFRLSAADYAPGGQAYKSNPAGYADGQNVRVYTRMKNEVAAKDPLTFYVDGLTGDGEKVGGLDAINKYWDEGTASDRLNYAPEVRSSNQYDLARPQIEAPADKCVARVWTKKFQAMHARPSPQGTGTAAPPLRPTKVLEAHNPAHEASQCLELITKKDFKRRGIKSVMGAVFLNRCSYPIETRWCIGTDRCARLGYDNLATMPASNYRSISYDAPVGVKTETRWAGCRLGFAHRPDFAGTLNYACK